MKPFTDEELKEITLRNVLRCVRIDDLDISEEQFERLKERILLLMKGLWDD